MNLYVSFESVLSALIYVLLGLVIFAVAFRVVLKMVLAAFGEEILEKQNVALATLVGLIALSIAIIVAAAVH